MNELLTAASLMLAIVGVIYGLWYPEINMTLSKSYPTFKEDRKPHVKKVNGILIGKACPLSIFSFALFLVFFPDAIRIVFESKALYFKMGFDTLKYYNAVNTAFCLVVVFAASIAAHSTYLTIKLIKLKNSLKK